MRCKIVLYIVLLILSSSCFAQQDKAKRWVDSVFKKMTLEEQIAQLMIIRVPSESKGKAYTQAIEDIQKNKIGGICFFAGTADNQLKLTKEYQTKAQIPLIVSIDGEWGLGMRLRDIPNFPYQMTLGAIESDTLIFQMGVEIAEQCKKMGIHINFAPDVDINNNPLNSVIGMRSFGENKEKVARKGLAYAKGLQSKNIIAVAKHFPGHGDTETDSHSDLPLIKHSKPYLDSVDLYPFQTLIDGDIQGVMTGHLQVPAYDATTNSPASLSFKITNDLLRKKLKFRGIIFTDGLDMKAVSKYNKDGETEFKALLVGADILLLPANPRIAIDSIKARAQNDTIIQRLIEAKCKKMLLTKYQLGLTKSNTQSLRVPNTVDKQRISILNQSIADEAVTLVKNIEGLLPLTKPEKDSIIYVCFEGQSLEIDSNNLLYRYIPLNQVIIPTVYDSRKIDSIISSISHYKTAIISISGAPFRSAKQNYGVPDSAFSIIRRIYDTCTHSVLCIFGTPYILSYFEHSYNLDAILVAYQNMPEMYKTAAQIIFGGLPAAGSLPVTAGVPFNEGTSLPTLKTRLGYKLPQQIGFPQTYLNKIDSIAKAGIKAGAYPGCQVLVVKDGYIVHNKSYGRLTYEAKSPLVNDYTIYDLASLTKVAATTLAIMKLFDEGKISLDDRLSKYLSYLQNTNKEEITIRETMSHIAGFKAYAPFWTKTLQSGKLDSSVYCFRIDYNEDYCFVTDSLCIRKDYKQVILNAIAGSERIEPHKYLYSDFGFILLADLVEQITCKPIDLFMEENYYRPLGMYRTSYNPVEKGIGKITEIAPTENDMLFRKSQVCGYVHDPAAAMLGGVAGHAGLFSTASDLAILLQMLLNGGTYGDEQFLKPETIETFNNRYYEKYSNRRALGFDKPLINGNSEHTSPSASQSSFGHSGFTGTFFWVDPQYNLVYIFLSNRVYPDAENKKLAQMNIRTHILNEVYNAIKAQKKQF